MPRFPRTGYGPRFLADVWGRVVEVPDYDVHTAGGRRCYQWSASPHVWMHSPPPSDEIATPAVFGGPTSKGQKRRTGKLS